jgi:hypothetical protein
VSDHVFIAFAKAAILLLEQAFEECDDFI